MLVALIDSRSPSRPKPTSDNVRPADVSPYTKASAMAFRVWLSVPNINKFVGHRGLVTHKDHHTIRLIWDSMSWVTSSSMHQSLQHKQRTPDAAREGACKSPHLASGRSGFPNVPIF